MALNRNKVKISLNHFPHMILLGEEKIGKTTLAIQMAEKMYGTSDAIILLEMGLEDGAKKFDDVLVENISKYSLEIIPKNEKKYYELTGDDKGRNKIDQTRTLKETIDEIINTKDETGIKMVAIDTIDYLIKVLEEEIFYEHAQENGGDIVKTLNASLGGFAAGHNRLTEIIQRDVISPLKKANIFVLLIGHTKRKEIEVIDPITGDKHSTVHLTNNLQSNLYKPLKDSAQMIITAVNMPKSQSGNINASERKLCLRSDMAVDCGSRFNDLPDMIDFDAGVLIDTIYNAIRGALKHEISDEEFEKRKIEDNKFYDKIAEKNIAKRNEENHLKDEKQELNNLMDIIKEKSSDINFVNKLKKYVSENKIQSLSNIEDTKILQEIIDL